MTRSRWVILVELDPDQSAEAIATRACFVLRAYRQGVAPPPSVWIADASMYWSVMYAPEAVLFEKPC
jgi:hypothetical protein